MQKEMDRYVAEMAANFKRGTAEMLILSLLAAGECYAYELTKALKNSSNGLFDIQGPTLYTALYRLQEKGFLSTREEKVGRRIRVYYSILPAGQEYLERVIREYKMICMGVEAVLTTVSEEVHSQEGEDL